MKMETKEFESKMQKSLGSYEEELKTIRAGKANPAVLDKITVDYYGSPTRVADIATLTTPDPRTITIQPWDKKMLKAIEKAILTSDLGINPQNDGALIRLCFPPLTEERRKELAKEISKKGEAAKVALRNIRRDGIDFAKAQKKAGKLTEDEEKAAEKDVQDLIDKYTKQLDKITEAKSKEIMSL